MQTNSPQRKKRIRKHIIMICAGIILCAGILSGIAIHMVLTPERITPIVLGFANEYLDSEVKCESVEVTIKTFPSLGVQLKNGSIIHRSISTGNNVSVYTGVPQDTLIRFRDCIVSFKPLAFLLKKEIIINQIKLNHPVIYAFVDPGGKANWDIFSKNTSDLDTSQQPFQFPELNLKLLQMTDAHIVYDDRAQDLYISTDSLQLKVNGNLSKQSAGIDLKTELKSLSVISEGVPLTKDIPCGIDARLKSDRTIRRLTVEKALFSIGGLKFNASGVLQKDSVHLPAQIDLDFKLQASSVSDLLQMIPQDIAKIDKNIKTTGSVYSEGKLKGGLGKEDFPLLTLSFKLENGSLKHAKHPKKSGIKKMDADFNASIDWSNRTPSYIHVNKMILESASSFFECSGQFDDIFTKPRITSSIKGNIDFNRMSQDFTFAQDMKMGGLIQMNLSGQCFLNDILAFDLSKISADGEMNIDQVIFHHPKEGIDIFASSANLELGSNVKDSIRGKERESLLKGDLEVDSLNLTWKQELTANMSRLSARFRTDNLTDTNKISRMSSALKFENLRFTMGDSIRLRASRSNGFIRMAPQENHPTRPEISLRFSVDSLRTRTPAAGSRMSHAKFTVKLKPQEIRNRRSNLRTSADSAAWAHRRDSLRIQNQDINLSFRLESNEARNILREWDFSGTFECNSMSLRTPYFPLPMRMKQVSTDFSSNSLSLKNTHLKAGDSDMILSGEIGGIRQALLRNGILTVRMDVTADSIDFNQIIRTIATGSEYADKNTVERDSISQAVLDDTKTLSVETDTAATGVFVIPANIDFELNSDIKTARYSQLHLKNMTGKIIIREQSVRFPDFRLHSDVGNAQLSLVYKAANAKGAYVGLDMQMQQVYVKELIDAFPMFDSLTPMLKSFEGVVDCNMTAVTELDSLMNTMIPKTTASCYLRGVNMVLLDGETFAEISKKLMFKNKKRNMIDAIAVEMILENGKILVFPFQMTLDRYTAGIGGTQNLDMSFNYHISVLKSPLPFKIGLNLSGTPDDMKIRLAKPKYNDLFTPVKVQSLEASQTNLRQQLHENLKKSIDEIIHAPATSGIRRPQINLSDSLNNAYFKMDTTKVDYPPVEEKQPERSPEH